MSKMSNYAAERNSESEAVFGMEIENMLVSSMGVRGLVNQMKNRAILKSYHMVKDHFGFDDTIGNYGLFKEILQYVQEVSGKEILSSKISELYPNVVIERVLKIDYNTFIYVRWENRCGYFYIFGKKSYKHYHHIRTEIMVDSSKYGNKTTTIFTLYGEPGSDDWKGVRKVIESRPFSTLYFDNNIEEKIKNHIDTWLKNEDIYKSRGITFKTGILLYGSPGTGKSSIASAIADYLRCNIILIDSATFKDININEVTGSISNDDKMYVVLLDDIDVILTSRTDDKITIDDKATISKLLSFLDSSNSPDNVIFVATTNHIELFDSAITRSGRFDKIIEVQDISKPTALRMCEGFGLPEDQAKKLVSEEMAGNKLATINPDKLQVKILEQLKYNIMNT